QNADHQMTLASEGGFQCGVATVSNGLPPLCGAVASADVVAAGMAAVQARRIEGGTLHPLLAYHKAMHGGAEELLSDRPLQQSPRGLLQGREVRHDGQAENGAQVGVLLQMHDDPTVVGLEEGLEDQAGEQLRLGVLLGTKAMRVVRQGRTRHRQSVACHSSRRFAQRAHPNWRVSAGKKMRGKRVFLQSRSGVFDQRHNVLMGCVLAASSFLPPFLPNPSSGPTPFLARSSARNLISAAIITRQFDNSRYIISMKRRTPKRGG